MRTLVISLGGSIMVPNQINIKYLRKLKKLILKRIKKGDRFVIVTGGGQINRDYNSAAKALAYVSDQDLDWLGIACTRLNAELIRVIFSDFAYFRVIKNPNKKIKTQKKIIIGSGFLPGSSTDKDAVILARQFKAQKVINLFDKDYVYDKDPDEYKNARPLTRVTWQEFITLLGPYKPRGSWPFDPVASKLARKYGMKVVILKGTDIKNLEKYLNGKNYKGTLVE